MSLKMQKCNCFKSDKYFSHLSMSTQNSKGSELRKISQLHIAYLKVRKSQKKSFLGFKSSKKKKKIVTILCPNLKNGSNERKIKRTLLH